MSQTFNWCVDKTRLAIYGKQLFYIDQVGTKYWYLNGKLHREDAPAIEYADGTKWWYLNGNLHRENAPAVEFTSGYRAWLLNGVFHRVNGPAVEYVNGVKSWFLNGKEYSESDYWKEL